MVDPPAYRTDPDPDFADRLERRLLHRLTAPVGSQRWQANTGWTPAGDTDTDGRTGGLVMLETEDRPTRPMTPRRRSPGTWLMVAAAAVVAAVLGALLVTAGDSDEQIDTVTPTPTTAAPVQEDLTIPVDPDGDRATSLRVTFQLTRDLIEASPERWLNLKSGPVKYLTGEADGFTGLFITTVTNTVSDGCRDHTPLNPPVGPTVDDLAVALTQLAPFEVTAPPTDVTLLGYQGKHLELTVPALPLTGGGAATASKNLAQFTDCVDGELHSWISPANDWSSGLLAHSTGSMPGHFNAYQTPGQTEEFWILDVEGTRLVLVKFDTPLAPAVDVTERDGIFDSIRIEP